MEEFIKNFYQFKDQLYKLKENRMGDKDTVMFIIGLFEGYNLHKKLLI